MWPGLGWNHDDWCDANGCRCGECSCLGAPWCNPPERLTLPAEEFQALVEELEKPAEVVPEIVDLARRHRERYW